MKLSLREKSLLLGMVLGDGYLQPTGKNNARLRLEHGYGQRSYLEWKVKGLPGLFSGKPAVLKRLHPLSKKIYSYVRHQSHSTPILGKIRREFYPEGKKIIPSGIINKLDPLSLAIWYMDDGYYYRRDRCGYLYLGNATRREAEIARQSIAKFFVEAKILAKKKGFALYFAPPEALKLKAIIGKFLLPEFAYKLPS